MTSSRRLHTPPDPQTLRRLTTHFRLNKEMIERRANQIPPGQEQRDEEVLHAIFGLMCSNAHEQDDSGKIAANFMELGAKSSEMAAMRLRGIDSYDLFDEKSRERGLKGLLIGYDDESDALYVQKERPYLYAPIRALAALETLIDIWENGGRDFWAPGVAFTVDLLVQQSLGQSQDMRISHLNTWMRTPDAETAAKGIIILESSDDFEAAIKRDPIVDEAPLRENLWFMNSPQLDMVLRLMDEIGKRIMGR